MTRGEAIILAMRELSAAGIESPEREARLLVSYAIRCEALELITKAKTPLTAEEEKTFQNWLARRAKREPLARIHGMREFWGLPFGMNEETLEPRPDTETLVEAVLKQYLDNSAALRMLDLGTGTGCILLSLLHEYPNALGVGVDISKRALEAATQNAIQLDLKSRSAFLQSQWFEHVDGAFDVIVSNPPYITDAEMDDLQPEVRIYDPERALRGGADGLDAYRLISSEAKKYLKEDGMLFFEVGYQQAEAVANLLRDHGYRNIDSMNDLQNITRVVFGVR